MERVIVAGVDRSARGRAAADWATQEALLRGLPLRVVQVSSWNGLDAAEQRPCARLSGASAPVPHSRTGSAEMIVLGLPDAGGDAGQPLDSTALAVLRAAACPVVLVPRGPGSGGPAWRPGTVTLGVDARDPAGGAVDFAFDAARRRGVRLHALHAWALPPCAAEWPFGVPEHERATWEDHEVQLLSDALRPWREKYPEVRVLADVVLLDPAEGLVRASGHAELIVVGRRLGDGSGTVARALLPHSRCPVAVVPSASAPRPPGRAGSE